MRGAWAVAAAVIFVCTGGAWAGTATQTVKALDKKLVEYGWDVPFTDFVRDHIRELEQRPFDGLLFKLRGGGNVLTPTKLDPAAFEPDYEAGPQIQWERFTDNFAMMWAASDQDWFNDEQWVAIEHNARLMARAARLAQCVGLCFDQEPYGTNPWIYAEAAHRDTRTFAEYEDMARRRGAQFMRAVLTEFPQPKILTFFQLSLFGPLLQPMEPADRAETLSGHPYGLLPAFLNGMLEAGGAQVTIIDGNENAYYYTDRNQYLDVYQLVTQRGLLLVDPTLWPLYRTQVQVGQALYIDQYFGLRGDTKTYGSYMTPEERARWCEHNVYWALSTTDEYVWCYSERMNWWTDTDVPPGCEDAIRSAREKLAAGEPLGFELKPIMDRAEEKQRAEVASRIQTRRAEIARVPAGVPAPAVDGDLADPVWQRVQPLPPFLLLAGRGEKEIAATQARVTYDNEALYIAFRCEEPQPDRMSQIGARHDDPVWQGDDVEVLVSRPGGTVPYCHFMVNPANVEWDAVHPADETADTSYNPTWQHGARVSGGCWEAELALPWAALEMAAPVPGTTLRANLCRQRMQGGELSSWSSMVNGFLEDDLFGTWVFG